MKKKIFAILCLLVAFLGSLYGLNIEYNIEEENTVTETIVENAVEETESGQNVDNINTEVTEVIISEETEEIVRDTIQATEERRRFKYN